MARGMVYGQGSGSGVINDVEKTTAVIKSGSTINKGDLITYDGSEVIKRDITDNIISTGNKFVFNNAMTQDVSIISLTDTKVLVSYNDSNNSYYGTIIILNINGNTITSSSPYIFNSGNTTYINTISLTDSKVLVSYRDSGNNYCGTSIILNIDGTNITKGSEYIFNSSNTTYISALSLTSTKVLVSYQDYSNGRFGTSIVLNINGDIITSGSAYIFNSSSTSYISAVFLTSTKVLVSYRLVCYRDNDNNDRGSAKLLNIDGTTITDIAGYIFNSGSIQSIIAAPLSGNKVIVSYQDNSNNYLGTSVILNINGTSISRGNEYIIDSNGARRSCIKEWYWWRNNRHI